MPEAKTANRRSARVLAVVALVVAAALRAPTAVAAGTPAMLEVFVKPGCSHCARAEVWLEELRVRRPDVSIVLHDIVAAPVARERLVALAGDAGIIAAVPAFLVEGRLLVGFDGPSTTGAAIEAWLDARDARADTIHVPWVGAVRVRDVGLPVFTLLVGVVDGFNPCAMWVLLFLLGMLVNVRSRQRMSLIGGTFVVVSGVVYFVFMSAWLGLFLVIGLSRWLQVLLGIGALGIGVLHLKDAVAPGHGPSVAIPASVKPSIYARVRRIIHAEDMRGALAATIALAVVVNLVELLCTAGLPALYTQILTAHGLPTWQYHAYLGLYIVAYMVDDALMLTIAVVTLSRRKLQERGGRILQLISGAVMVVLAALLLLRPEWLSFR